MTKVEDAKVVLHGLESKLTDARARHADTQAKAAELAYPANTGDEGARKKLDGLNAKVAMVAPEIASLEAAIGGSGRGRRGRAWEGAGGAGAT